MCCVARSAVVYFRAAGLRQPHWQSRCRQLQAFLSQPQEQVLQSQVLPQLQVVASVRAVFFELDILFLPFLDIARDAHSKRLTLDCRKHYSSQA